MTRVPFQVSARAARLIGRENVASSQGAVTELVKNAYDADASVCAVLFKPRWDAVPTVLDDREFRALEVFVPELAEMFIQSDQAWHAVEPWSANQKAAIDNLYGCVLDLWIVDNGHGMPTDIIKNHWMVIGTDAKDLNGTSKGGRVVTGAKGIGRFALDRLGQQCEMFSAAAKADQMVHWRVDWSDFEGTGKVIGDVEAVLETEDTTLNAVYRANKLVEILPKALPERDGGALPIDYSTGTAIRIGLLNDVWDEKDSMRLKETLEALLPPHDRGDFDIFVHDHRIPEQSGFIDNFPPDQFDYRMLTTVSRDGNVEITLQRQEIDVARISPTFFTLEPMKKFPYRKSDFEAGQITYSKRLEELLDPGDELESFLALGPFTFTFYFFKLTNATTDNLARFPQKNFDVSARRRWLNSSGGIRLYRDNFRVRPYGEPKSTSYDWLSIGERSARNPVQASRPGWRVLPQQIAGTIHITKRENSVLSDQSNREGIMNERAFSGFRKIIVALIREFEKDRAYILQHFSIAYDQDNPEPMDVEEGRKIAEKVLEDENSPSPTGSKSLQLDLGAGFGPAPLSSISETELRKVSKAYGSERKKNEVLRDNIQVMRGMATLGTVLVSFTHELRQIRANIDARSQRLADAIQQVVSDEKMASVDELSSPFRILDRLKKQDEKITRWVNFALSAVSPSKRRRRRIDLGEYLQGVRIYWDDFLQSRSIAFTTYAEGGADLSILAHEIDLDSVFYNLINNSVEALVKPTSSSKPREISVNITAGADGAIVVDYSDNGPGLSGEFTIAEDIFLFGVTSKKEEANGEAVGTGLGMWLLKNVVDDYGGTASLKSELGKPGFAMTIRLPASNSDE